MKKRAPCGVSEALHLVCCCAGQRPPQGAAPEKCIARLLWVGLCGAGRRGMLRGGVGREGGRGRTKTVVWC